MSRPENTATSTAKIADTSKSTANNTQTISDHSVPQPLAEVEGVSPGAGADILANRVSPGSDGAHMVVRITIDEATTVTLTEDVGDDGTSIQTHDLNDGGSTTAGAMASFTIPVRSGNSYNVQIGSGTATVSVLEVIEYPLGSA